MQTYCSVKNTHGNQWCSDCSGESSLITFFTSLNWIIGRLNKIKLNVGYKNLWNRIELTLIIKKLNGWEQMFEIGEKLYSIDNTVTECVFSDAQVVYFPDVDFHPSSCQDWWMIVVFVIIAIQWTNGNLHCQLEKARLSASKAFVLNVN